MGDPKFQHKKYVTPDHPWQKERLESERAFMQEYGIRNKKELWKMESLKKRFAARVKELIADESKQSELEMQQLLGRMYSLGLIEDQGADVDVLLSLELKSVLDRRLQTLVLRKNLAHTIKQARQFIVHGHIYVKDKKMTSPSHITKRDEEAGLRFSADSKLAVPNHPEVSKEVKPKKPRPPKEDKRRRGRRR